MSTSSADAVRSIAKGHPGLLFATLMLGMMAQGLAFTAFVSALPQMAHDLGDRGEFVAQMTMALAALGLMFGALVSGWILEKAGARTTMLAAVLVFGVAGAGGMVFRDPALLLASRFLVGFSAACIVTTCVWGISAEYEGDRRARALGISTALGSFAGLAGMVLGGYLAQRGGWPLAFVQYPVFGAAGLVLALWSLRQVRPESAPAGHHSPFFKRLLPFYLLAVLLFAVMFMGSTQFAFLLEEDGVKDPGTRSLIMATVTLMGTLTSFCYGAVQQRLSVLGTFVLGLVCMAVSLAIIGWGTSPASAVLGAGLMGIYVGLVAPYVYHAVTERTDTFIRSRAIGVLGAFCFLGGFLNPLVFATMSRVIGLRNVFLVVALVMAGLAVGTATNLVRQRRSLRAAAISH